jgi:hypothetical protein
VLGRQRSRTSVDIVQASICGPKKHDDLPKCPALDKDLMRDNEGQHISGARHSIDWEVAELHLRLKEVGSRCTYLSNARWHCANEGSAASCVALPVESVGRRVVHDEGEITGCCMVYGMCNQSSIARSYLSFNQNASLTVGSAYSAV